MTMLMVSILVLVVISLALDVLILATLGDMVSRLFKPKQVVNFSIDARGSSPEAAQEAVRQAIVRQHYDA
jgi:hypothetical protein